MPKWKSDPMRATNETRKPTATPNGKTSRRDAKKNNTRRIWRTVTRNGVTRLVAPDGTRYTGTAREVRDAALMPDRRNTLAQSLRLARYLRSEGTLDAAECRAMCEDCRREAIRYSATDAKCLHGIPISAEMLIKIKAGSRLVRGYEESFEDYLAEVFRSELDALLDVAQSETGRREIPMTRHERAALARISALA